MTSRAHEVGRRFEDTFRAAAGPAGLVRSTLPEEFLARLPVDPFDRPLFIDADDVAAFGRDLDVLLDCLARLPYLLDATDPGAIARLVGLPPDLMAAAVPDLRGMHRYGRADVYHDGTGLRLLEMGLSSAIGGAERAGQVPALLVRHSPAFASFAQASELHHLDPVDALLAVLGPDAAGAALPMIEATGALEEWAADWQVLADRLREEGLDPVLCELDDLKTTAEGLCWRGSPVVRAIRLFTALELDSEPRRDELAAGLLDLTRRGSEVTLDLRHEIFNSKACLALLWSDEVRQQLTDAEREAVARILPPSRLVGDRVLTYSAVEDVGREHWMLKATSQARGEGHVTGWTVDERAWARALEEARGGGWMLQRRVVPRIEPGLATDDPEAPDGRQAVWGYFYGPAGYAGMSARLVPAGTSSIFGDHPVCDLGSGPDRLTRRRIHGGQPRRAYDAVADGRR